MSSPTVAPDLVAARPARLAALRRRPVQLAIGAMVALAIAIVAGIALGTVAVSPADTVAILAHRLLGWPVAQAWPETAETIVMELRLPRVLTALIVGFGLAVAGTTFQGLLRNPLADPYVLGTASGAALGAAIAVLIPVNVAFLGLGLVNLLAFVGALLAVVLVLRLAGGSGRSTLTTMLLVGYAVGSLLAAGLTVAMYLSGQQLRQIFFYLLGSFAQADWQSLVVGLPLILAGSVVILARARSLNALLLGDDTASHLGIDVRRERAILLGLASLVTAAAVALAGLIGFVGLVVPHVVRLLVGPNARLVLPLSAVFGAAFLILADLVARIPGEIPVGVVTAVIGAPVFLILLRRFRSGYEL
jgi:iron complex transport system permease protein